MNDLQDAGCKVRDGLYLNVAVYRLMDGPRESDGLSELTAFGSDDDHVTSHQGAMRRRWPMMRGE